MFSSAMFIPVRSRWSEWRTYLFVIVFAAGNLLLPQLIHAIPSGGRIFLPIYFFTLIAAYKFGAPVGLATALLSPILNSVLFGMPLPAVLPVILIKSTLLAMIASLVAEWSKRISLLLIVLVVVSYQLFGSLIEWSITQRFTTAVSDVTLGIPGMLLQIFGGWLVLHKLAQYE